MILQGAVIAHAAQAEGALAALHPDYRQFVASIRPIRDAGDDASSGLYMALVRPGAQDPTRRDSAPFAGLGARNDILYDPTVASQFLLEAFSADELGLNPAHG